VDRQGRGKGSALLGAWAPHPADRGTTPSMGSASWRAAVAGAFIAALITLPGLGSGTLWDNSETAYGEVAREVLLYHDPVVMHLNGLPWFVQPPLYFWIAALFARLFGVTSFALRLPSALATVAMAACVGYAVARVASARAAVLSAVILSTTLMVAIVGRLAIMDALLDLAVTVAILAFAAALRPRTGSPGGRPWFAAWIAMALGVLAKGPVAVVVTALVVVPWVAWERALGTPVALPRLRDWVLGLVAFGVVAVPWYVVISVATGGQALGELIGHYSVGRYLGTIENQTGPIWYYLPVVILGFFPWFAFLPPALWSAVRAARSPGGSLARLVVVWAVLPFLFFSLAKTKLPNYIALEFPAFAICVGLWFDGIAARGRRRAALAWTVLVPFTIAGVAFAIAVFSRTMHLGADTQRSLGDLMLLGAVIFAGSVACFCLLLSARTARFAPYSLALASFVSVLLIALVAEPHVEALKPIPALAKVIRDRRTAHDLVAIEGVAGGNALVFYTEPHVATLDDDNPPAREGSTDPRSAICGAARAFVVTSKVRPSPDPTYGRTRHTLAVVDGDVLYLYDGPACQAAST
jgi:4-amino-4-deoxy-L-arabinose transferase-like glycosyltransferase